MQKQGILQRCTVAAFSYFRLVSSPRATHHPKVFQTHALAT